MFRDRIITAVRAALPVPAASYAYHLHTTRHDATSTICPSCHVATQLFALTPCEHKAHVLVCARCETVSILLEVTP